MCKLVKSERSYACCICPSVNRQLALLAEKLLFMDEWDEGEGCTPFESHGTLEGLAYCKVH